MSDLVGISEDRFSDDAALVYYTVILGFIDVKVFNVQFWSGRPMIIAVCAMHSYNKVITNRLFCALTRIFEHSAACLCLSVIFK